MKRKRKKLKVEAMSTVEEKTPKYDQVSILVLKNGFVLDYDPGNSWYTSWNERPQYAFENMNTLFIHLRKVLEDKQK